MLSDRRGLALVTTLWILAALVVLAVGVGLMARTEAQISHNFSGLVQCRWAARAAINRALVEIERLKAEPNTYLGETGLTLESAQDDIDLGDASYQVVIEDEAGGLNINSAGRGMLESLFGSRGAAECIMDWRDQNDQPLPLGAETQHYSGLPEPYRCKNRPFDTVRELLLVKEIDEELLGSPAGMQGKTLADLLTVYSHDEDTSVDGEQRINVQTAGREQLLRAFRDVLTEEDVDAIISRRNRRSFRSAGDIIRVRDLGRDKVSRIYDRITVRSGDRGGAVEGLVNANTAAVEVLAAVPGMDQSIAREIVEYRQSNGPFEDVGKILDVAGVTDTAFSQAADNLTVRSRVYRITATGHLEKSRISSTIVCVVDASDSEAQFRYWRE
ncbi:MAG: general secretion pathway protein GspK [Armatimonadetes bacterium]|nr:general secretion pathway protein GspK [Armatimonadota bacterium]